MEWNIETNGYIRFDSGWVCRETAPKAAKKAKVLISISGRNKAGKNERQ